METLGPGMWYLLHMYPVCLTLKKVTNDRQRMMELYECIQDLMPCISCKLHMVDYSLRNSIHFNSNLSIWIGMLHNEVNRRIEKKPVTYMEEYKWCQDCITCSMPDDGLHVSRKLWMGIRYVLASILTTVKCMSATSKVDMVSKILDVCHVSFPSSICRESFKDFSIELTRIMGKDGRPILEVCATCIADLDATVGKLLQMGFTPQDSTLEGMLKISESAGQSEESLDAAQQLPLQNQKGRPFKNSLQHLHHDTNSNKKKKKKRGRDTGSQETGEFQSGEDMFQRMMPLISGNPMNMYEELEAGFFDREADDEGRILKQNMWIPSDTRMKPFYVNEVQSSQATGKRRLSKPSYRLGNRFKT